MGYEGKVKGRRKKPYPNSILDRKALTEALEEAGISVKRMHVDEFYKTLHKQQYPPLAQFVENYYANERKTYTTRPAQPQLQLQHKGELKEEEPGQIDSEQPPLVKYNKKKIYKAKSRNKMTLPRALLDYIATTPDFVNTTSRVKEQFTSADKTTTKLIVELYDGFVIESVLMRYRQKGAGRASLCVSSQCGCAMGCTFCATGTMGKRMQRTSSKENRKLWKRFQKSNTSLSYFSSFEFLCITQGYLEILQLERFWNN
jgi:hypothetical protein